MKKVNKLIILTICSILTISSLTSNGMCTTTIGDSTFPADEGDVYTWEMTYCHPNSTWFAGVGSYYNLTIEKIYRDTYFPMTHALIVNATKGEYMKGLNAHISYNVPDFVVYNASLQYINLIELYIVPIPLNLSMIAEYYEGKGHTCTIDGTTLTIDYFGEPVYDVYKFNSNGFATTITMFYGGEIEYIFQLGGAEESEIPFGNYYILFSILTVICLIIVVKKRYISLKK